MLQCKLRQPITSPSSSDRCNRCNRCGTDAGGTHEATPTCLLWRRKSWSPTHSWATRWYPANSGRRPRAWHDTRRRDTRRGHGTACRQSLDGARRRCSSPLHAAPFCATASALCLRLPHEASPGTATPVSYPRQSLHWSRASERRKCSEGYGSARGHLTGNPSTLDRERGAQ